MSSLTDASVRQLQALVAVAEFGTFGAAAERLGYSQAAVSQQIAALERAAGQPLFLRQPGPRRVSLTSGGRLMVEHAQAVISRLELAQRQLTEIVDGTRGQLSVGTFQSVSVKVLPRVVTGLRRISPDLEFVLYETEDNADLLERAAIGALDVTFAVGPVRDERLAAVTLGHDPYVALVATSDTGPDAATVAVGDLDSAPVIGLEPGTFCQLLIENNLHAAGVRPKYVFHSNDNGAVQAMVRAGLGTAVMPLLTIDRDDPGIRVLCLEPPMPPREIVVAYSRHQPLSAAAEHFIRLAREALPALEQG